MVRGYKFSLPAQHFSNIIVHSSHPGTWWKYRFWSSRSGLRRRFCISNKILLIQTLFCRPHSEYRGLCRYHRPGHKHSLPLPGLRSAFCNASSLLWKALAYFEKFAVQLDQQDPGTQQCLAEPASGMIVDPTICLGLGTLIPQSENFKRVANQILFIISGERTGLIQRKDSLRVEVSWWDGVSIDSEN